MNRKVKQKRRPNSAVSGGIALGRISRRDDPPPAFAAQPRRLDEFEADDADRDRAGEAEHLGRIEHGDGDDQHGQRRSREPTG